jgi:hypothetical protein
MKTKAPKSETLPPEPVDVRVTEDTLSVDLADGRTISVPLAWFPRLVHGTKAERKRFELSVVGVHWPDLDEDISVEGLLRGQGSGESASSLNRWLGRRANGGRHRVHERPLPRSVRTSPIRRGGKSVGRDQIRKKAKTWR